MSDAIYTIGVQVDNSEIVDFCWLTPAQAVEKHRQGQFSLLPPTLITLLELQECDSLSAAQAFCQDRTPPSYAPRIYSRGDRYASVYEDDCAYSTGQLQCSGRHHRSERVGGVWHYINEREQ